MRFINLLLLFFIVACGNKKEVLLPKSDTSVIKDIRDISLVYFFFKEENKDTLAEINKQNLIGSTHWVFNIDKRLSLSKVIPEIQVFQTKRKAEGLHKNYDAQDYYSYADSIGKNLAFLNFTKIQYKQEKPKSEINTIFFGKDYVLKADGKRDDLFSFKKLAKIFDNENQITLCFDKNISYENYLQVKVFFSKFPDKKISSTEFIY